MTEQTRGVPARPAAPQAANPTKKLVRDAETQARVQGDRMSILVAIGTRPEAIKMIPVVRALQHSDTFFPIVISTGGSDARLGDIQRG
jgi:hypothetical protein